MGAEVYCCVSNMYLCYSNENKELYHCHSVKSNDDVLFTSYNDVGWKRTKNIIVPNSTFSFRIESNFGYEGHKYLRFRATYNLSLIHISEPTRPY